MYEGFCRGVPAAIKILKYKPDVDQVSNFKHEVEALRNLNCPQIVKFYGMVEDSKQMIIVMELCSRGSLFHVMNSVVYDFGWDRLFVAATEMVRGMIYLHEKGFVHRDFKSLNILVTDDWQIKVIFFTLSNLFSFAISA